MVTMPLLFLFALHYQYSFIEYTTFIIVQVKSGHDLF